MKRLLLHPRTALVSAIGTLALAVVLAFAPSTWPTMMLRSFLPQWLMLFTLAALWSLLRRRWRDGLMAAAGSLMIAPMIRPPGGTGSSLPDGGLRIAHFNVLQSNDRQDAAIATMLRSNADLIGVQEVDPVWAAALIRGLSERYPYHVVEPRTNCYGIALFSRVPLRDARVVRLAASPVIAATAMINGEPVRTLFVHTSSPGSPSHFAARNAQLDLLAREVHASPHPVLVVGDLNATPWDRDLRRFLASTGLRSHSTAGDPTFPVVAHMALIPIDHVLSPPDVIVHQRSVHLPGSDHRGLIADVSKAGRS